MPKQRQDTRNGSGRQGRDPYPYRPVKPLPGQIPLVPDLNEPPDETAEPQEPPFQWPPRDIGGRDGVTVPTQPDLFT
jgi:hypothetical protein